MYFGPSFTDLALQGEGITDSSPPKLTSAEVMSFTFLVHQLPPLSGTAERPHQLIIYERPISVAALAP
ncbi:hypothetical protein [Bradyrhizobium sp. USDA 4454]